MPKLNDKNTISWDKNNLLTRDQSINELSSQAISNRIKIYHLNPSHVLNRKLILDLQKLDITIKMLSDEPSIDLEQHTAVVNGLQLFHKVTNWADFCNAINTLRKSWVQAYAFGATIDICFSLSETLKIKQWVFNSNTLKFQRFLSDILMESTTQFDKNALELAKRHNQQTGLPNLNMMLESLQQAILFSKTDIGLLLLSFKMTSSFSDGYRHLMPELTNEIVKRLTQNLPKNHFLFQLDAYEFCVLSTHLDRAEKLDLLAAKLRRPFELTLHLNNQLFAVSPVIGGVHRNAAHQNADEMYTHARLALADAIKTGKLFSSYTNDIDAQTKLQERLRQDVLDAFENDRLEVYFQPIVESSGDLCKGAETLLRCKKANGEFIPPPLVIEVLYQQGFGSMFIRWLLSTVCRLGSTLKARVGHNLYFTVNLSADDIIDRELPHLLQQCLALWGLDGQFITLEITENGLLLDEETANQIIHQLTELGCGIALDDFGTGYSSMARLRNLPIDLVKIDQSFVRNLANSDEDREIVQAIIALAHGLGKQVVAEGVEDAKCLATLSEMQCEKIQGYYFSKPLPFEDFVSWVQAFELKHDLQSTLASTPQAQ